MASSRNTSLASMDTRLVSSRRGNAPEVTTHVVASAFRQHLLEQGLGDDAPAHVGVADDQDAATGDRSAQRPSAKTSFIVSLRVAPLRELGLERGLPSSAASHSPPFFALPTECQPCISHTVPPPTRKISPWTPADVVAREPGDERSDVRGVEDVELSRGTSAAP